MIPGLVLLAANGLWIGLLIGLLCARYRDLPPIVASIIQVAFFVTPVIWIPGSLSGHAAHRGLVSILLRSSCRSCATPCWGKACPVMHWVVALAITMVGWILAFLVFARFRARITYWL